MEIKRRVRLRGDRRTAVPARILVLALTAVVALVALAGVAYADQLVINGDFRQSLGAWKVTGKDKFIDVRRDEAGSGNPGSIAFILNERRGKGRASATQRIAVELPKGSKGQVTFAWKKNWFSILPLKHTLTISLIKPDKSRVLVWIDTRLFNNNTWVADSVDISKHLNQSGTYQVVLGAEFENGNSRSALTQGWFDDVKLDITSGVDSRPRTSFLNPTGTSKVAGTRHSINGVAWDDRGIAGVEVLIHRTYDDSWWNGSSWVKHELWNNARVVAGKGEPSASWSYSWPLPTSDGAFYKIAARAIDITGNHEALPVEQLVSIDNCGPTGSIYIEDAASYTAKRRVSVDIDVRGAVKMRLSPDDGRTWSDWEAPALSKQVTLPKGDGAKVVSAQFVDNIGNSYQVSDSIVLDATPPVTRHTFPAPDAKDVPLGSSIGVTFYESMDKASITNTGNDFSSTFYLKQEGRWIWSRVSYDEKSKSAKLTPLAGFRPGTTYTVYLTTGIKDTAGNSLAANHSWSFTTKGTKSAPGEASAKVGKAGGRVDGPEGSVTLDVPSGVLGSNTEIKIEELNGITVPPGLRGEHGPVYGMTPAKLYFSKPATLTIKFTPEQRANPANLRLVYYDEARAQWRAVGNARIDLVNNQAVANVSSLTAYTLVMEGSSVPPSTSILAPTGIGDISGASYTVYGISYADGGVASVDVAIIRQADNSYWNGSEWQEYEAWIPVKIVAGQGKREATWSYALTLPKDKGVTLQIKARAVDTAGTAEFNPSFVQVKLSDK